MGRALDIWLNGRVCGASQSALLAHDGFAMLSLPVSAQRPEARSHLFREELRLLPGCKVATPIEPVVIDQVVGVGALRPALGRLIQLVGEDADCERDGDVLGVEEGRFVLPIEAGRRAPVFVNQ